MRAVSRRSAGLSGVVRAPGDKSCSHRAVMLAAAAAGSTRITGLLEGEDVINTARAAAALGAGVRRLGEGEWVIEGVGERGFATPAGPLDFGNSGTGVRLMMGLAGGYPITADFVGDASLSSRPMERVLKPLRLMGVRAETAAGGRLPVRLSGGGLQGVEYAPPEPSAQVKSAILLAALNASGETVVSEREETRDHTERMLRAFGVTVDVSPRAGAGPVIRIRGGQRLIATEARVAGDPSSAAFIIAAGIIAGDGPVSVEGVLANPTRLGLMEAIREMGGAAELSPAGEATGEETVNVAVRPSRLRGIRLDPRLVPAMIDELPIFAVLAAFAEGRTVVTGAAELRVKESDRIRAICAMLAANGVRVEEIPDGFIIDGGGPAAVPGGGLVRTHHDHRIAMSSLIMGLAASADVAIDDTAMIATSYPSFFADLRAIGAAVIEAGA
jgi:3-phosphoshikimate 1-carboxyvinyltransferase